MLLIPEIGIGVARLVPILLCVVTAILQVRLVIHCKTLLRSPAASRLEYLFDLGAFIFLVGIQGLLLRSFLRTATGGRWIAVLLMSGIAIVVVAVSANIAGLLRR
jgi:hypothetical protein